MILNNFYNWRKNGLTLFTIGGYTITNGYNIKDTLGVTHNNIYCSSSVIDSSGYFYMWADNNNTSNAINATGSSIENSYGVSIRIGNGDTAPTADDYTLESPYTPNANYTHVSSKFNRKVENDKLIFTITTYFSAITDLTIKESCLISMFYDTNSNNTSRRFTMLTRNLLEEPLNVTAGEAFSVTETIEIPLE